MCNEMREAQKFIWKGVVEEAQESQLQEMYGTNLNIFSVCY